MTGNAFTDVRLVGSFDAGFGSAYLARVVGEKRAREIWFLLDQYDAATAERLGLVNAVVPPDKVVPTAVAWGKKIAGYSPTAIRFLKHSFNADTTISWSSRTSSMTGSACTRSRTRDAKDSPRMSRGARRTSLVSDERQPALTGPSDSLTVAAWILARRPASPGCPSAGRTPRG